MPSSHARCQTALIGCPVASQGHFRMADRLALGVVPILRQGEISPTLAQFRLYWFVALDMERQKARRKIDLIRPEGDPRRERALYCMERQEEVLDRAYADMREMAPTAGERAVEVITAHYLEGEDWHDLSARIGIAYDKCKKIAYKAFREYEAAT